MNHLLLLVGGVVLFVCMLITALARRNPASRAARLAALTPDEVERVSSLLRTGERLPAIKSYREITGAGLAESLAAIDHWNLALPATANPEISRQELGPRARSILANQGQIEAIKWVRQASGMGLAEAKAFVDGLD